MIKPPEIRILLDVAKGLAAAADKGEFSRLQAAAGGHLSLYRLENRISLFRISAREQETTNIPKPRIPRHAANLGFTSSKSELLNVVKTSSTISAHSPTLTTWRLCTLKSQSRVCGINEVILHNPKSRSVRL